MPIQIKPLDRSYSVALAELSNQLGYNISPSDLQSQIEAIIAASDHAAFVAIDREVAVGYIHGFQSLRLTSLPFFEIAGLVVREEYRNKGIGKMLVEHIIENAANGVPVRVRCNVKREGAHRFYGSLGFKEIKEQKVFTSF